MNITIMTGKLTGFLVSGFMPLGVERRLVHTELYPQAANTLYDNNNSNNNKNNFLNFILGFWRDIYRKLTLLRLSVVQYITVLRSFALLCVQGGQLELQP
jgi:hypothetical protein